MPDLDADYWSSWPDQLWGYGLEFEPDVDLCVRALIADGLRVHPFDRHAPGDGRLSALGMTPELWRDWFEAVVQAHVVTRAQIVLSAWRPSQAGSSPGPARRRAPDLWPGPPAVGTALVQLSVRAHGAPAMDHIQGAVDGRALWRDVQRFRSRVPHFWIFVVRYAGLVALPLPPAAVVMSDRVVANGAILRGLLTQALEELAAGRA